MTRLKNLVLAAAVLMGTIYVGQCHAQDVCCLQYCVYADGYGDYLYYAAGYSDNTTCVLITDEYAWETQQYPCPQGCGECLICGEAPTSKRVKAKDLPFPGALPDPLKFKFGTQANGNDLPTHTTPSDHAWLPTDGITVLSSSWVKVQPQTAAGLATGDPIPVKLFVAKLDFAQAGIPDSTKTVVIRLGFQMANMPEGEVAPSVALTPIQHKGRKYTGIVNVTVDDDTFTYRVMTKTPLFGK